MIESNFCELVKAIQSFYSETGENGKLEGNRKHTSQMFVCHYLTCDVRELRFCSFFHTMTKVIKPLL